MVSRDPSTAAARSAPPGSAAEVPGDDAVSGDEEGEDHEVGDAEREPEQGAAAAGGGPDEGALGVALVEEALGSLHGVIGATLAETGDS